jgi:ABC-type multidrug transport system fused ATPase/permease subunit
MLSFPLPDPGQPDLRSPARFLAAIAVMQRKILGTAMVFGILWMATTALTPYLLGRAIDDGIAAKNAEALWFWTGMIFLAAVLQAGFGVVRHRYAVQTWLGGALRTQQWLTRQSARLGATLPKRLATGEVVAVSSTDIYHVGNAFDVLGRTAGSIVAFGMVSTILLQYSTSLGLVVLIGVPLMTTLIGPIVRPLHKRQVVHREQIGRLTAFGADTVAGLRVLRGIGGEDDFLTRYRERSQNVRQKGVSVWRVQSFLDAAQVGLPALFIVVVTWLGAHMALRGEIAVGELVAFYSYSAFLVTPLRTITETVNKLARALVASRRVIRVLVLEPEIEDSANVLPMPAPGARLRDDVTGIEITPGTLTAIVGVEPAHAVDFAHRITRCADSGATLGGVRLSTLPLAEVRKRVVMHDHDPRIFTGSMREVLDPLGRNDDAVILRALDAASGLDILDAVSDGLDTPIEERGRSLSGGQRQRLALARTLLINPEIVVMEEATSAVDAHTEARVAHNLRLFRQGRTTVVLTGSPLMLDRADEVFLIDENTVIARGRHHDLLRTSPEYRFTVTREEVQA